MAGAPIKPRISINDMLEFVSDESPGTGGTSWEESAQSLVYDVPFAYVYDAILLLLGYAYTEDVVVQANGLPNKPLRADGPIAANDTFTGNCTTNSFFISNVSDFTNLAINSKIYRASNGLLVGTVVAINGVEALDASFQAIQLDTAVNFTATTELFQIGDPVVRLEKRKFLRRLLPMAHPIHPWMVCTRIDSWKGIGPRGKGTAASRLPLSTIIKNVQKYTSIYSKLRLSVTFTMPKYKLAPDPFYGWEAVRYLWREQSPSADFITIDKGTMVYGEGGILAQSTPFVAPGYAQPEVKQAFSFYWSHVPEDYINTEVTYTAGGPLGDVITETGLPIRFVQSLQCVNLENFMGHRPGTLLMQPYEYERFRMPLEFTDAVPRFWARLKMNIKYFNPKTLPQRTAAAANKFGHLLAPLGTEGYAWIRTKSANPDADGKDRYNAYDFNNLFYPLMANERTMVI